MPQSGFHALAAVALANRTKPRQAAWTAGLVLGALLPDIDIVGVGLLRLAGHDVSALHRGATHSLLVVSGLLVAAGLVRFRAPVAAGVLAALGLGALTHVVLDIFFWFSGIDLLWPFSAWWGWPRVDLWSHVKLPALAGRADLIANQLGAWEAAAMAIYFGLLARRTRRAATPGRWPRLVWALSLVSWGLFAIYVVTGTVLDRNAQEFIVYASWILLLFPAALVATLVLRRPLAGDYSASVSSPAAGLTARRMSRHGGDD